MFVWIFHRISGVLLIVLLCAQLLTGFFQTRATDPAVIENARDLHLLPVLNCLIVFLLTFHALYGIRTILMDLGLGREKLLFWGCNAFGLIVLTVFFAFCMQ